MGMKINDNVFEKRMKKLEELPHLTMDKSFNTYRNTTPIRSGNARNKTKQNKLKFRSNYPYAGRLDEGWSKQAPKGFSDPTIDYIEEFIETRVGKI